MGTSRSITVVAVGAALAGTAAVATTGAAQDPSPQPPTSLALTSADRATRFGQVDAPPRRRESAGDMFTVSAPLRDASGRPAGRAHVLFVQTSDGAAQGSGTLVLAGGRIAFSGIEENRPTREFAVTGGTGSYVGAAGTIAISGARGVTRFRVTLTR